MAGLLCGQIDPPLNAAGIAQATAMIQSLKRWPVRRLYSSDLQRAVQTARPLAELWNIPVIERANLREISFGSWEGRRWSDILRTGSDIRQMESSGELCAPGGEAFAHFRIRIVKALKEVIRQSGEEALAIVTHLGAIRVILAEIDPTNRIWNKQRRIEYCAAYRLRVSATMMELIEELNGDSS